MLYFHAAWSRAQNPAGQDVTLLSGVKGKGRFLGVSIGLNVNPIYKDSWWGEGEVKMYIDGDSTYPTINGTGSEDYIGTAWNEGFFANQFQGCLVADALHRQYAFYRFHVPDAIYFFKDFKATIQQIGGWLSQPLQALRDSGVDIQAVSLGGRTFRALLEPGTDRKAELQKAGPSDWENFYRSDDYAVTAYYYLDKPNTVAIG